MALEHLRMSVLTGRVVVQAWRPALVLGGCVGAATMASLLLMRLDQQALQIWLPNAMAVSILLRWPLPSRVGLPVVALAILAANLLMGAPPLAAVLYAVANTLEVMLALALIARWRAAREGSADRLHLDSAPFTAAFVLAGCFAPAVSSLVFVVLTSPVFGWQPLTIYLWWQNDVAGFALLSPVIGLASRAGFARLFGRESWRAMLAVVTIPMIAGTALVWAEHPFTLTIVPLMLAAAVLPPLGMALISFATGLVVLGITAAASLSALHGISSGRDGLEIGLTVCIMLPVLGCILIDQARRDRLRVEGSERRFRQAMRHSPIGMLLLDLQGRILESNHAFATMLGYSLDELQQRDGFALIHPDDGETIRAAVDSVVSGRTESYRLETRYLGRDGAPVWTLLAGSVVRDEMTGTPLYRIAQVEDISARKMAEAALADAERRWRFVLQDSFQGVWDYDANREATYYSPVWKRMLGYGADELQDSAELWASLLHPDDREQAIREADAHLAGEKPVYEAEFRMRHKDGRWRWMLDRGSVIERDAAGKALRMIGLQTDITRHKEDRASLAAATSLITEEKERLRITLHAIADAVICTDAQSRVMFMNPAAETITGIGLLDACGQPLDAVFACRDAETGETLADRLKAFQEGEAAAIHDGGGRFTHRDGRAREIRAVLSPIMTADQQFAGSAIVFQDVTDALALERELAHAASHDALTGLPNRLSFVRALQDTLADARESGRQHALLFVDLDRFKAVNDTAGHLAGDALLQAVAVALRKVAGPDDLVARLGGDEFALILRGCAPAPALRLADALVQAIGHLDFVWGEQSFSIGASVGLARIDPGAQDIDQLVARADKACYASKAAGRSCATAFQETAPDPRGGRRSAA